MMQDYSPKASCTGIAQGKPAEPCVVVIFGVAGDLSRKTLIPSLYALGYQKLLPEPCHIIGIARREWDDEAFRQEMQQWVQRHHLYDDETWQQFAGQLHFHRGDLTLAETYKALQDKVAQLQAGRYMPDHVLLHLSTPPELYRDIIHHSAEASLLDSDTGWRRIIIEKPFGHDAESARQLDRELHRVIAEEQLYRVDHYLGKETVQNMLAFRFANPGV